MTATTNLSRGELIITDPQVSAIVHEAFCLHALGLAFDRAVQVYGGNQLAQALCQMPKVNIGAKSVILG